MALDIAHAGEAEIPACLALLPELTAAPAELLIARCNGAFAGAAGIVWANVFEPAGFHVAVHVLPGARRQGVGRALVAAAVELADAETDGLWSHAAVPADSDATSFLQACGFAPRRHEHHFQVGVDALLAEVGPIAERFRARGHIPPGADILPLTAPDAPIEEIGWLVAREFNGNPGVNAQSLRRRLATETDRSLFARLGGALAGVLLWRVDGPTAIVDLRVARQGRVGWANLALLDHALRRGHAEALDHILFFSDESMNLKDTAKLAARGAGREVGKKARWYLAFDGL